MSGTAPSTNSATWRRVHSAWGYVAGPYSRPVMVRFWCQIVPRGGAATVNASTAPNSTNGAAHSLARQRGSLTISGKVRALWAAEMIELGQVKPEAIDLINVDELGRLSAEAAGVPNDVINGQERLEEIRMARAEAAQEQQQVEQIRDGIDIAKTGAEIDEKLARAQQAQQAGA